MITDELIPRLQGIVPSIIASCSNEGVPNSTIISQVFQVDNDHVAVSNQFFTKTHKNVKENPFAQVQVLHPETMMPWILDLQYIRTETEGDLFEDMEMQLEAIASMSGMSDVFKLQAADVFKILSVKQLKEALEV